MTRTAVDGGRRHPPVAVYGSRGGPEHLRRPRLFRSVRDALLSSGVFVFSIEHPIYTAPSSPEFVIDTTGRATWPLDQYLVEGSRSTDWLAPGVGKQHRTIGTYVSLLHEAGFVLSSLEEWGPCPEQIAEVPAWGLERERPPFLLVRCRR